MSIYSWSTTAGTNASSDASINWAEGQMPSTVNDSARAMMAALAAWLKDSGGGNTTGGTSSAYTLTNAQPMLSKTAALVAFKAHATNAGTCTLNVDGLGASPLRSTTAVELAAGQIVVGNIYLATWVSGSSEWLIVNNAAAALLLSGGTMTGALTLSGAPTVNLHAATKLYVDTQDNTTLAKTVTGTGGLTGGGAISSNPTISVASAGITSAMMANNAILTANITDANVTPAKLSQPLTRATSQATTSGTSFTFSSIPSWVSRIIVSFSGVTVNGVDALAIRIGDSGGVSSSGYSSTSSTFDNSPGAGATTVSFTIATTASGKAFHGNITLVNITGNTWVASGVLASTGAAVTSLFGGSKTLTLTLDRLQILSLAATAFSAGTVNIQYE